MCSKGCGRHSNSGLNFTSCCSSCTGQNSIHTPICMSRNPSSQNAQNVQTVQPIKQIQPLKQAINMHMNDTVLLIHNNDNKRKSVDVDQTSSLFKIISNVQNSISNLPNYNPPYGNKFHVELVKVSTDKQNKDANFNSINGSAIDLCKRSNWKCVGGGFSLVVGANDLHITIGYFGSPQNCQNIVSNAHKSIEQILGCKLH
jgi:hypothetical protein